MALKYPNKIKRAGYWKRYEKADIKDFLLVWNVVLSFIKLEEIPFRFAKRGRRPTLSVQECVAMSAVYVYFDLDFRELEFMVALLSGKHLDHSNCVRWFGKLTPEYIDALVYQVHEKILEISDEGDYIADSSNVTSDRLKAIEKAGDVILEHITWKVHILVMYLLNVGLVSIVSIFPTKGNVNDSPVLRNKLLRRNRVIKERMCHTDKGYFGKENIRKCKDVGLKPNIVPKEQEYSDKYLIKYIKNDYNNRSRKKNRGLVEGVFGGFQTETDMRMRCRKTHHRMIYISLLGLKHNIRTYLRAIALVVLRYFAPTPPSRMKTILYSDASHIQVFHLRFSSGVRINPNSLIFACISSAAFLLYGSYESMVYGDMLIRK